MPALSAPLPQFFDLDGSPLDAGRIYIGTSGANPQTSPIAVYWDSALTQPAAQPLRTLGGYIVRAGSPSPVFYGADGYSITVRDSRGSLVLYQPTATAYDAGAALSADLASTASGKGDAKIGVLQPFTGAAARTQHAKNADIVSVLDFGADPTGVADSASAFAAAIATGKIVWRPAGIYRRGAVTRTHTDGFEGVLWIGNGIINNSDDAQVVVSRDVDSSGSGNAHSFTDSSVYSREDVSHNSYDDRTKTTGDSTTGHHASYQVGAEVAVTGGTLGYLYSFITSPIVSAGTLTNYIGLQVNSPTVTGSGAVTNCYGMYLPLAFGKGGTGFNPATGVVLAINNESHAMVYSLGSVQGQDGLIGGNGAGTAYTNVKTIDAVTNSGTAVGVRLQQQGTQIFDLEIPASQTYLTLSNVAGEVFRVDASKNMIWQPSNTPPTLTVNGQLAITPTSNTNARISYRGSDGVTRVANIALS